MGSLSEHDASTDYQDKNLDGRASQAEGTVRTECPSDRTLSLSWRQHQPSLRFDDPCEQGGSGRWRNGSEVHGMAWHGAGATYLYLSRQVCEAGRCGT